LFNIFSTYCSYCPFFLNLTILFKSLVVADEENQQIDKLSLNKVSLTSSLTDVNEDLINEKNNEIGRVTKWAIGFDKLLQDPLGLKIFTVIVYHHRIQYCIK
jgi:hypothetical protein